MLRKSIKPRNLSVKKDVSWRDRAFRRGLQLVAGGLCLLLLAIGFFLFKGSTLVLEKEKFSFLTQSVWDPVQDTFGILPVIYGTFMTALLALLIAAPLSVAVALFLNEVLGKRSSQILRTLVELLAAIPSVVYGLWGIFVLVPWMRQSVQPFFGKFLGFLPFFQGAPYGVGLLTAALILSIMILPTMTSLCREVFEAVPRVQREAALALGCTKWEMMKVAILNESKPGIFGAILLGFGRAVGETMAVTMVIGNRAEISASLFSPAQTMASVIANEYAEAVTTIHSSALMAVGLVLFILTLILNALARMILFSRRAES